MSNPADQYREQGRDKQVSGESTEESDLALVSQKRVYDARVIKVTDYKDTYEVSIYQQGYDKDPTHSEIKAYPLYDHDEFVKDEDVQIHLLDSGFGLILPFRTRLRQVVIYDMPITDKPIIRFRDLIKTDEAGNHTTGTVITFAKSRTFHSAGERIMVFNRKGGTDQKDSNNKIITWEEFPTIPEGGEMYDVLQIMDEFQRYGWDEMRLN